MFIKVAKDIFVKHLSCRTPAELHYISKRGGRRGEKMREVLNLHVARSIWKSNHDMRYILSFHEPICSHLIHDVILNNQIKTFCLRNGQQFKELQTQ